MLCVMLCGDVVCVMLCLMLYGGMTDFVLFWGFDS